MTVRINKPALNLREELTKAQSVVPYSQQQFWMDGLVENGTFDTADGWTFYTNWGISGGTANVITAGNGNLYLTELPQIVGKRYRFSVEAVNVTGAIDIKYNNATIIPLSSGATGNYSAFFTSVSGGQVRVYAGTANGSSIDNVRVFEVDENDEVIHSLPLGFKPLHVYEDGLIQREGAVHDYTVVKTGGAYAIKPAVQPTATTETCVIAEREL